MLPCGAAAAAGKGAAATGDGTAAAATGDGAADDAEKSMRRGGAAAAPVKDVDAGFASSLCPVHDARVTCSTGGVIFDPGGSASVNPGPPTASSTPPRVVTTSPNSGGTSTASVQQRTSTFTGEARDTRAPTPPSSPAGRDCAPHTGSLDFLTGSDTHTNRHGSASLPSACANTMKNGSGGRRDPPILTSMRDPDSSNSNDPPLRTSPSCTSPRITSAPRVGPLASGFNSASTEMWPAESITLRRDTAVTAMHSNACSARSNSSRSAAMSGDLGGGRVGRTESGGHANTRNTMSCFLEGKYRMRHVSGKDTSGAPGLEGWGWVRWGGERVRGTKIVHESRENRASFHNRAGSSLLEGCLPVSERMPKHARPPVHRTNSP